MTMATETKREMKFVQKQPGYEIMPHPDHKRLYHIQLDDRLLETFFAGCKEHSEQSLRYVPYSRQVLAHQFRELFGQSFMDNIREILQDRESGGFTISVQGKTEDVEDFVKFGTALTHLIGIPNFDAMTGTFYARFTVKDTDNSDSYLRQAYRLFTLHTDGTFVDEPTDWLLMMKMDEKNAVGGESRLLHLDDWEDLEKFSKHPLANVKITYKAPPSKNVEQVVHRATFYEINNKPCICFIDQFAYPETIEQALYLKELSESLENSPAVHALKLPVGDLVILNNSFWMHGRAPFEKHPELYRELMRQRGYFARV
ncbi:MULTISPECIES: glutarate dioxygenase GlaH [Aneurinibacillus]|uniref:Carbon starvation induced protein CsiD n=1 Tax=Aneurinibacillus thermoaerophilus TaxID=143495 RepID=A0ABX8YDS2_ANETH|nr:MULTISPECIES: glutarate dioxygenase GlaH [Aneurinibacillus]AMA73650.1 protein CsiD [Aneurinibacillus sp. XH2]MED0675052.1 glutarate dioxygenase GlaH [Aneurinibacillus thermoaerophilus]MED0679546.1 glutarate dioxygenase GlaH [Aneurinibacillus thermoaerophilus]MED0737454.1 glutarate dioxygenase GlaH [Aneurinibacillus thermoaerophilus]MED0756304.1 glutarate dioxygenase GlaH [Aneurinibacillus thermoaerophilus]